MYWEEKKRDIKDAGHKTNGIPKDIGQKTNSGISKYVGQRTNGTSERYLARNKRDIRKIFGAKQTGQQRYWAGKKGISKDTGQKANGISKDIGQKTNSGTSKYFGQKTNGTSQRYSARNKRDSKDIGRETNGISEILGSKQTRYHNILGRKQTGTSKILARGKRRKTKRDIKDIGQKKKQTGYQRYGEIPSLKSPVNQTDQIDHDLDQIDHVGQIR